MAKKKKDTAGFKQDKSMKEKKRIFLETTIGEALVFGFTALVIGLTIFSYHAMHPTQSFVSQLGPAIEAVKENPLYPVAVMAERPNTIGTILGSTFLIVMLIELWPLIEYYMNRARITGDLDTLKGSTEWVDAKDITKKYADAEDE